MTHIGDRWLEPQVQMKLARWYWCGVFGELYGSASETRIALDLQDLLKWINQQDAAEPATVIAAGFQSSRLDTLRAERRLHTEAYTSCFRNKAQEISLEGRLIALIGTKKRSTFTTFFPANGVKIRFLHYAEIYDSIVNKTAISYKANRKIGGKHPRVPKQIETDKAVQLQPSAMDEILKRIASLQSFYERMISKDL